MAFVVKTARTLRNNWKKSTFAVIVLTWGGSYTKHYFDTRSLMKGYCERAAQLGSRPIAVNQNPRTVTVILNPNANKRKAQAEFEKYCAPLLHLAGISLEVIKTESEGHAKQLIESVADAEAVVVAGGDGTLSEVVTGLLRRTNENCVVPIGVLPLGKNNTVARLLFPAETKLEKVKSLADATMAVIEEVTKPVDVMRIEILDTEAHESRKPIYAVSGIKWGAYRDAEVKKDSYWYFGGLKKYATYLLNGLKGSLSWDCQAQLVYSPPCTGCSNCRQVQTSTQPKSWWFQRYNSLINQLGISFIKKDDSLKYQRIHNPQCTQQMEKQVTTADLTLFTSNAIRTDGDPKLNLRIGPQNVDYMDFVKQGWKSELGESREVKEAIEARTIEINPKKGSEEAWFSIDNENYEVKPIRVTLLPKVLNMFCQEAV
ncbi:acylglycerol kinase, mitochondrial [Dendroctonus ponderosae]|uniref:Acylglycerol kinase, mitochondrial n=1 Tax=Dendroctonus ponderosae TaxID=77166 RepID=U4UNA3_DENPD|nr:acylglycerol kinase, mitochondrial [Dendroctonus ponderosae]ERL95569.1 hypothetical protein D910_12830 [Dendroctonus ponderosae]KAH1027022.1 hypothetical protein HUJ05_000597 [Dendroctonus ponderosae]